MAFEAEANLGPVRKHPCFDTLGDDLGHNRALGVPKKTTLIRMPYSSHPVAAGAGRASIDPNLPFYPPVSSFRETSPLDSSEPSDFWPETFSRRNCRCQVRKSGLRYPWRAVHRSQSLRKEQVGVDEHQHAPNMGVGETDRIRQQRSHACPKLIRSECFGSSARRSDGFNLV